MSKRKSYDVSFKLKAVKCAEKKSKEVAAHRVHCCLQLSGNGVNFETY